MHESIIHQEIADSYQLISITHIQLLIIMVMYVLGEGESDGYELNPRIEKLI